MFGFGKDSEQKLEQNMEQIKNLVEDGEPEEASQEEDWQPAEKDQKTWDAPDQEIDEKDLGGRSQEELEEELQDFEKSLEEEKEDTEEPSWDRAQQEAQSEVDKWSGNSDTWEPSAESVSEDEEPSVETAEDNDSSANAQGRVSRDSGVNELNNQIPEPAETRKLDIPEVEKGPLFIRQRKFERAAQLISDMQYLTDQVEATINSIEEEIQRSSQTEQEVRELIDDFEAGRSEVEEIVSPSE